MTERQRGGQPGNKNATKNRPITDALRRVLLANDGEKMRQLTDALVNRAINESDTAAKEIFDRIEGRVKQQLEHTGEDGEQLFPNKVEVVLVRPDGA